MAQAAQKLEDNIVSFSVYKEEKKQPKLKLDGTPKCSGGDRKSNVYATVEPIRDINDLGNIRQYFRDRIRDSVNAKTQIKWARNYALWVIGTNTALRISDILKLKWSDIFDDNNQFNNKYVSKEKKTGKFNVKFIKEDIQDAILLYCKVLNDEYGEISCEELLFSSPSNRKKSITTENVNQTIKEVCKAVGINYNVGTHTMRKTYSYWYLINNKCNSRALTKLMGRLNHSSPQTTLAYAGITEDEFEEMDKEMSDFYRSIDKNMNSYLD